MTNEEAIRLLKKDTMASSEEEADKFCEAFDLAVEALEMLNHIKNRPCMACEFQTENGCCKWECVFDKYLRENVYKKKAMPEALVEHYTRLAEHYDSKVY